MRISRNLPRRGWQHLHQQLLTDGRRWCGRSTGDPRLRRAMQRLRARCLLGVCLAVAHMPLYALAPELVQALDRFDQAVSLSSATSNDRQRGAEVALAYERHVAPWVADKTALDESARHRLFRAVHAAYFYTLSDDLIPDLEASFGRLRADGAERPEETRQMAAAFVASRQ